MRPAAVTNQRIADRLLAERRIDESAHRRAVDYATRHRTRIEDALVELEILSEADLLKYVATVHGTRFVSTDKLMKASIDARVLAKVTRKTADLHGVYPVLYDEATRTLSVVTADPDNGMALDEVKIAAAVREVRPFVGRPAAVRAAIARDYHGDRSAFTSLTRSLESIAGLVDLNPFERTSRPAQSDLAIEPYFAGTPASPSPAAAPVPVVAAPAQAASFGAAVTGFAPTSSAPLATLGPLPGLAAPAAPPIATAAAAPAVAAAPALAPTASPEFLEILNVLVSLLENGRADLRGHSSTVARLTRKTCERIGLGAVPTAAFVVAAYVHDLGKFGAYHLTALNVAEYEGHRVAALKLHEVPAHLLESVGLAPETVAAIDAMYERYDGQGLPNGQSGKEIPLGARILAVADTYADLTQNPRNPYRKTLRPAEACEVLAQYRGAIFDPNIVDLFKQAITGEDMRARLLADRHPILIVDPDPEETTVLELRMIEQGFEVRIARTAAQARRELEAGDVAVVVSEVDLEAPDAGLALRSELRGGKGSDVAWVVLTGKTDRATAQRAFDLGVDDFVSKPASTDIFVAKLKQLLERRSARSAARGVSGSLAEMSLPDMVQILWHGRKTCALEIQARGQTGSIFFADGQIVAARWETREGEDAFFKMLTLREGDFRLDPNGRPAAQTIHASPEALLLEGMRRLDEGVG